MLAFGLGTLPAMLGLGLLGQRLRALAQQKTMRRVTGGVVLAFGVVGLLRAAGVVSLGVLDMLCITPHTLQAGAL